MGISNTQQETQRYTVPYVWKDVQDFLSRKWSLQKIGDYYGRNKSNVSRYIKRQQRNSKLIEKEERHREVVESKKTQVIKTEQQFERMPKYGDIAPTFYKSTLNNDDWIDKYIEYDYDLFDDQDNYQELYDREKKKWSKAVVDYLSDARQFLWDANEGVLLLPRRYGKTESVFGLFVRYVAEIRLPLFIVTPGGAHARDTLNRLYAMFKGEAFRKDYGDIIKETNMNQEMRFMRFHDDFNWNRFNNPISIVTWSSAKEGRGAGWIHFEDVMQVEYKNLESISDIEYKYNKTFEKMRTRIGGIRTKITATGTRYATEDWYYFLMHTRKWDLHHVKALEDDNKTWLECPNYYLKDLLNDKKIDLWSFETSMNNNPLPRGGLYYDPKSWKVVDDLPIELVRGNCYIAVDPAYGKSTQADFFALVIGVVYNKELWIVKTELKKGMTFDQQIEMIRFYQLTLNPLSILVEATFQQVWLTQNISKYITNLIPIKHTAQKEMRLDALDIPFRNGLIKICKGMGYIDEAERQFLSYDRKPSTKSKKDDWLDGVQMLYEHTKSYLITSSLYIRTWNSKR